MQGFIQRQIPVWIRRAVTMIPAFVVVALGVNPSRTLVLSQVVLSFGIPFALDPAGLVHLPPGRDGRAGQPPLDHVLSRSRSPPSSSRLNVFLIFQVFVG